MAIFSQPQYLAYFDMAAANDGRCDVQLVNPQVLSIISTIEDSQLPESAVDIETFLQALREYKCLWDNSDPNYKNQNMKLNAWQIVSSLFNQEGM